MTAELLLLTTKTRTTPDEPQVDEYQALLERVIESVSPYIGLRPYVWGGKSPNPGFDCSGLVGFAYKQALGNDVFSIWFTDTMFRETVDSEDPQQGEIVFYEYDDPGQPGVRFPHMGLWFDERTTLDSRGGVGLDYHPHLTHGNKYVRRIPYTNGGGETGVLYDTTGVDIMPYLRAASAQYGIPVWVLGAIAMAESSLNPNASREGVWPDVSYGLMQMTVATAQGYGIGDGTNTTVNKQGVKAAMLDRRNSIMLGSRHYAGNVSYVRSRHPGESGDTLWLNAIRVYNGGSGALDNPTWEQQWAGNIENYRRAMVWAKESIGE